MLSECGCVNVHMASFSLEYDGIFMSQNNCGLSDNPFENVSPLDTSKSSNNLLRNPDYSDISDDDFEIPCLQKRLNTRYVCQNFYLNIRYLLAFLFMVNILIFLFSVLLQISLRNRKIVEVLLD